MSRQYDDFMEGKFELYDETHELIDPNSFDELMKAFEVKDLLQTAINSLMHDEDSHGWSTLLQLQEDNIQTYLDSIGEFDNSFLVNNINYLAKSNDLRIGEVESMIGLSAGYISRTAKENSAKKLSVDVVWKIARLFEVDIKALLETNLLIPNSNSDLAIKFLEKAYRDTEAGKIEWICNGGVISELDTSIEKEGLITYEDGQENEVAIYHSKFLNPEARFVLEDDIFACENISLTHEVLIIPFKLEGKGNTYYEFLFRRSIDDENDPKYGTYVYTRVFTTADDPFMSVSFFADKLYKYVKDREYDTRLSPGAKSIISDYLKSGEH